jgi:hypothetical protein
VAVMPCQYSRDFGERFAAEVNRLSDGHLNAMATERLRLMDREDIVGALTGRLSWLGRESIELLSNRGPEELARAVAREEARVAGEPAESGGYLWWLGGLLDALAVFRS